MRGPLYLTAHLLYRGDDQSRLNRLAALAERHEAPLVATNDAHYHVPALRPLQHVLTAIQHRVTVAQADWPLAANAERHLKCGAEMARLFWGHEAAIVHTVGVVRLCSFSLDEVAYQYPDAPVPAGTTPQRHMELLTWAETQAGDSSSAAHGDRQAWQRGYQSPQRWRDLKCARAYSARMWHP